MSPTWGNLHLGKAVFGDKQSQGDNRFTGILHLLGQFIQFLAIEQQFAVALRLMVGITTEAVLRYVHLFYP